MESEEDAVSVDRKDYSPDRMTLIRDVIVFQGKLALDGLRDLLLSPVSLILAILDLTTGNQKGRRFYDLLYFGHRTDRWINLFGNANRVTPPSHGAADTYSVDQSIERLENILRQQKKNGLTDGTKASIDDALDALMKAIRTRAHKG